MKEFTHLEQQKQQKQTQNVAPGQFQFLYFSTTNSSIMFGKNKWNEFFIEFREFDKPFGQFKCFEN